MALPKVNPQSLNGLIPLPEFDAKQAWGTWYQQLRLNTPDGKPPSGENQINVIMNLGLNPAANTKDWLLQQNWPYLVSKTYAVPTLVTDAEKMVQGQVIKQQFSQFGNMANQDFQKIGTTISNVAQQVPGMITNPSSIAAMLPNIANELKGIFTGGAGAAGANGAPGAGGFDFGSLFTKMGGGGATPNGSQAPAYKIKSTQLAAQPTEIPAVWNIQTVPWLPWPVTQMVVLDAGYSAAAPPSSKSYDYLVVANPDKKSLDVYTRSKNYDPALGQMFVATAQKNGFPADAAQRMFIIPQN